MSIPLRARPGLSFVLWTGLALAAFGQESAFEKNLPEGTLGALVVPDLPAFHQAMGNSELGKILAEPEVRAFLDAWNEESQVLMKQADETLQRELGLSAQDLLRMAVREIGLAVLSFDKEAAQAQQRTIRTMSSLRQVEWAIESFQRDVGRLPRALKELTEQPADGSTWYGPYLWEGEALTDAWGNPLAYAVQADGSYSLKSLGADGKPAGQGPAADISSKDALRPSRALPLDALVSVRLTEGSQVVFDKLLERLFSQLPAGAVKPLAKSEGVRGWTIDSPMGQWTLASIGAHYALSNTEKGHAAARGLLQGRNAGTLLQSAVYQGVRSRLAGTAPLAFGYLDVQGILSAIPDVPPPVAEGLAAAGFDALTGLGLGMSAENGKAALKLAATWSGEPRSLLKALFVPATPKTSLLEAAARVPASAHSFAFGRNNLVALWDAVWEVTGKVAPPREQEQLRENFKQLEAELGFSIRDDALAALSKDTIHYLASPDGGGLLPYNVFQFRVGKPGGTFDGSFAAKLGLETKQLSYRGRTIHYLQAPLGELGKLPFEREPRSPQELMGLVGMFLSGAAFVQDGEWLIASNTVQALKSAIDELEKGATLAGRKDFQADVSRAPAGVASFSWSDGASGFAAGYNTLLPIVQFFEGLARKAGIPLNLALAPRAQTLAQHMKPSIGYALPGEGGGAASFEVSSASFGAGPALAGFVGVTAAIAIPNLLRARASANEASAISSLRTIVSSQAMFYQADLEGDGEYDYARTLAELGEHQMVDPLLAAGGKSGYVFELHAAPDGQSFWIQAGPMRPGDTGNRWFWVNEEGTIRQSTTGPATAKSEPIR